MPPGGVHEDCVAHKECIRDVGNRLNADQLLFLVIVRVGARVQIDSTWAEVSSGRTVPRDAILLEEKGQARKDVFAKASKKLIPNAELKVASEKKKPPDPTVVVKKERPPPVATATIAAAEGPTFLDDPRLKRWQVVGGVGLSAVSLIVGSLVGLNARSVYDSLKDNNCIRTDCTTTMNAALNATRKGQINDLGMKDAIADILFLTSVLSAGTAAYYFFFVPPETPSGPATIGIRGTF
jgi:hypothetical protein